MRQRRALTEIIRRSRHEPGPGMPLYHGRGERKDGVVQTERKTRVARGGMQVFDAKVGNRRRNTGNGYRDPWRRQPEETCLAPR